MKTTTLHPLYLGHPGIFAASSLLNFNDKIFVCCDDQYSLYELKDDHVWVQYNSINSPDLPTDPVERKRLKPDFETLLSSLFHDNTILLIPSGSKSNRINALKFDLTSNHFSSFDMSGFYKDLASEVQQINIEGSAVFGGNYLFMNRGIQSEASSLITVDPTTFKIKSVLPIDFGSIEGVRLHGSELCVYQNNLFALAVAEASPNSYDDGEIFGSSIFKISLDSFNILDQWKFDRPIKAEGLCRWKDKWLVVTDPDGVGISEFFSFTI